MDLPAHRLTARKSADIQGSSESFGHSLGLLCCPSVLASLSPAAGRPSSHGDAGGPGTSSQLPWKERHFHSCQPLLRSQKEPIGLVYVTCSPSKRLLCPEENRNYDRPGGRSWADTTPVFPIRPFSPQVNTRRETNEEKSFVQPLNPPGYVEGGRRALGPCPATGPPTRLYIKCSFQFSAYTESVYNRQRRLLCWAVLRWTCHLLPWGTAPPLHCGQDLWLASGQWDMPHRMSFS